jgi:hypothetical protein
MYGSEQKFIPPLGIKRMAPNNTLFHYWIKKVELRTTFYSATGEKTYGSNNILFRHWIENVWLRKTFYSATG